MQQSSAEQRPLVWFWNDMSLKQRMGYAGGLAIAALTSAMLVINPLIAQHLIDDVIVPGNTEPLLRLLAIMLVVKLGKDSLRYLLVIIMERNSTRTMTKVREKMYDVIQRQDFRFFDGLTTGNLMTRMTSDLDMLRHTFAWISYQLVDGVTMFLTTFTVLMFVNWKLALCLTVIMPFILFLSSRFIKTIHPHFSRLREKLTELSNCVTENIGANRVVKAFAREDYERAKFERHNAQYRDNNVGIAIVAAKYQPLLEMFSEMLQIIILIAGGVLMMRGEMSPGQMLAFSSLTWTLALPLRMLAMLLADLQRFRTSAKMILEIITSPVSITDPAETERTEDQNEETRRGARVEFRNVNFSLNGAEILNNVNFCVEPGQTIGILGSTGAGKTSLINMLLRFYEPSSGEVLLDDRNVAAYTLSSLRKRIGLAMQDVFLFSDTVANNIAYGRPGLPVEDIARRAVQADAASFVTRMSDGYDTLTGERGVGLSGGQKQRISLARALAVKPALLILDDTTSAVDGETEQYIQEQLGHLDYECTKIIIAHRITSFYGADMILVMDGGRIIERGTHEQLLAGKGFYHHIWKLQHEDSSADALIKNMEIGDDKREA